MRLIVQSNRTLVSEDDVDDNEKELYGVARSKREMALGCECGVRKEQGETITTCCLKSRSHLRQKACVLMVHNFSIFVSFNALGYFKA